MELEIMLSETSQTQRDKLSPLGLLSLCWNTMTKSYLALFGLHIPDHSPLSGAKAQS